MTITMIPIKGTMAIGHRRSCDHAANGEEEKARGSQWQDSCKGGQRKIVCLLKLGRLIAALGADNFACKCLLLPGDHKGIGIFHFSPCPPRSKRRRHETYALIHRRQPRHQQAGVARRSALEARGSRRTGNGDPGTPGLQGIWLWLKWYTTYYLCIWKQRLIPAVCPSWLIFVRHSSWLRIR